MQVQTRNFYLLKRISLTIHQNQVIFRPLQLQTSEIPKYSGGKLFQTDTLSFKFCADIRMNFQLGEGVGAFQHFITAQIQPQ